MLNCGAVWGLKGRPSDTVMAKNIDAAAFLSDKAQFLPKNCRNYKCFSVVMFISFVCIGPTQKNANSNGNQMWQRLRSIFL